MGDGGGGGVIAPAPTPLNNRLRDRYLKTTCTVLPPSPSSFMEESVGMAVTTEHIYRGRGEIGGVYVPALSARAYTTTLLVMVDRVKRGGRAPSNHTRLG